MSVQRESEAVKRAMDNQTPPLERLNEEIGRLEMQLRVETDEAKKTQLRQELREKHHQYNEMLASEQRGEWD